MSGHGGYQQQQRTGGRRRAGGGQQGPRQGGGRGQGSSQGHGGHRGGQQQRDSGNRGGRRGGGGQGRSGGGGGQGRGRGGGGGRGGHGGPDLSNINRVLTNILPADVSPNFSFYIYSVDYKDTNDNQIEHRGLRADIFHEGIFDNLLKDKPNAQKESLRRILFHAGSFFFAGRPVPGLEKNVLPKTIVDGTKTNGNTMTVVHVQHFLAPKGLQTAPPPAGQGEVVADSFRCMECLKTFKDEKSMLQHCAQASHSPVYPPTKTDGPATMEIFLSYVNTALQRAMGERMKKWGDAYIDESAAIAGRDRNGNDLGISIYEAFDCKFGAMHAYRPGVTAQLTLTVDLRAKILRTKSLLDLLYEVSPTDRNWKKGNIEHAKKMWIGERVMYMREKKGYTVVGLDFENSPRSLMVPGKKISHEQYFKEKGVHLEYPDNIPMVVVLGRQDREIFLPAELVSSTELAPNVREMLPMVASFKPETRSKAIDKVRAFITPGAQKTKGSSGLLPSLGILLRHQRLPVAASVLAVPVMKVAGVPIPERSSENWAPVLARANYNVSPDKATMLSIVLFHNDLIKSQKAKLVFERIRDFVNARNTKFRLADSPVKVFNCGRSDTEHINTVTEYFGKSVPSNLFVIDFVKPKGAMDTCYPVVKQMLGKAGHVSQFVSFKTYAHDDPQDSRKSDMILQGVARQILQKSGVAMWWVSIPEQVPLPVVFVGVDVFHSPPSYDPVKKKRVRKPSCAAIIVQVQRQHSPQPGTLYETYSQTFKQAGGEEFKLENAYKETIRNALAALKVSPASCIVWRDGIADASFPLASSEIQGIRNGLSPVVGTGSKKGQVPLAFITAQKRISEKFLAMGVPGHDDGSLSAPAGTMISAIQGVNKETQTFFLNGRAPPYSTAKPVRFVLLERDDGLMDVPMSVLTWSACHAYPNWTGPVKVPSCCQMAHRLAELAGTMPDSGETIDHKKYTNKQWFL